MFLSRNFLSIQKHCTTGSRKKSLAIYLMNSLLLGILCSLFLACSNVMNPRRHFDFKMEQLPNEALLKLAINQNSNQVSILQNLTTENESSLSVLRNKNTHYRYQILSASGKYPVFTIQTNEVESQFEVDQIHLRNLDFHDEYYFFVLDPSNYIVDTRKFSSLNANISEPRIAVASCARVGWMGIDGPPISIYDELAEQKPDVLVFLGDIVYPDTTLQALFGVAPSDLQIQKKYVEAWQTNKLYHLFNLFPVMTVMDDHDYGFQGANHLNNSANENSMLTYFRRYYPVANLDGKPQVKLGPGAAFSYEAFGFRFVLLDNKYFRTASGPEGREGSIWGEEQLKWLRERLDEKPLPTFIGSGTLFSFPVHNQDAAAYESPAEYQLLKDSIHGAKSKVILMSGDVHFSDVHSIGSTDFGYPTYEITASRLHSISPLIIPPFISGWVGPEKGQPIHTANKNFTLLKPKANSGFNDMIVEIHEKNSSYPLKTVVYPSSN